MARRIFVALVAFMVAGCGTGGSGSLASLVSQGVTQEATVTGTVTGLLSDGNGPAGPHQRFILSDGSGPTVEVDHNLTLAPRVPLQVGSQVAVHGEFVLDPGHPLIHDTHHATGHHQGGWIEVNGQRYQ